MNSFVYARKDWPPRISLGTVVYTPTASATDGDRASLTLDAYGRLRVSLDNASVTLNVEDINFGYVGIEDALGNKAVLNSDGSFKAQITGSVAVTSSTLPVGAAQDTTIQSGNSTLAGINVDTTAIKGDTDTLVSGQTLSNSYLDDIWTLLNGGNLKVSWTVAQAVTQSGVWTVGLTGAIPAGANAIGSVTANAGSNLNTSALALESGGNLATVATAQGAQGSGASFNPPTGGSGILGYLSGIYKAITGALSVTFTNSTIAVTGAVTATLGAGTSAVGTVLLGQTAASGDTSITSGATAQNLFSGATPTNGFSIANPDAAEDLWFSDSTTAVINGQGSVLIPAGWLYETPPAYKPVGAVSVIATTTGHKITARKW